MAVVKFLPHDSTVWWFMVYGLMGCCHHTYDKKNSHTLCIIYHLVTTLTDGLVYTVSHHKHTCTPYLITCYFHTWRCSGTAFSIRLQVVSRTTFTSVGATRVDALLLAATIIIGTLVDVYLRKKGTSSRHEANMLA